MNKLTLPALLLGVVMIAGAFAFMPVQEATTVHTVSGNGLISETETATMLDDVNTNTHTVTFTFSDDALVYGMRVNVPTTDTADDYLVTAITANGLAVTASATITDPGVDVDLDQDLIDFTERPLAITGGNTITIAVDEDDTNDGADETMTFVFVYTANTGTTISASAAVVT